MGAMNSASAAAGSILTTTSTAVLELILALITMYYVLIDWSRIAMRLERVLPLDPRHTRSLILEMREVGRSAFVGYTGDGPHSGRVGGYWVYGARDSARGNMGSFDGALLAHSRHRHGRCLGTRSGLPHDDGQSRLRAAAGTLVRPHRHVPRRLRHSPTHRGCRRAQPPSRDARLHLGRHRGIRHCGARRRADRGCRSSSPRFASTRPSKRPRPCRRPTLDVTPAPSSATEAALTPLREEAAAACPPQARLASADRT